MTSEKCVIQQRNNYFDLLKYILFVLVVLIHNPLPESSYGGIWTAIARSAVPTYFAISGYFSTSVEKKQLKKGANFLRIYFMMNLVWLVIYTLIACGPYGELARWAKLDVNPKNIFNCIVFGSAFGNEYLWYLHAIGTIYITVYLMNKFRLDKVIGRCFPLWIFLYWIMSEGTLIVLDKSVQPCFYRNWLIEGIGFYYMGKWMKQRKCHYKFLYVTLVIAGSAITAIEYKLYGRVEFYFGNIVVVYGLLALGKTIHVKDNILSRIGGKHSLHLYLYSPFVALVLSLIQISVFKTTEHQEVITGLVVMGTTWLVNQGWFAKLIRILKIL